MITRDNINNLIYHLPVKDKNRIKNTNKEYIVLLLSVFNAGYILQIICTNDLTKYQNVSKDGNCILTVEDPVFDGIRG